MLYQNNIQAYSKKCLYNYSIDYNKKNKKKAIINVPTPAMRDNKRQSNNPGSGGCRQDRPRHEQNPRDNKIVLQCGILAEEDPGG